MEDSRQVEEQRPKRRPPTAHEEATGTATLSRVRLLDGADHLEKVRAEGSGDAGEFRSIQSALETLTLR
jgi:hypothetical protein